MRSPLRALVVLSALALLALTACEKRVAPRTARTWVVGQAEIAPDPHGPPDPVRWSLERLLGRGLVSLDSSGVVAPDQAKRIDVTADGLTYTFHLDPRLRFADDEPCRSSDFRRALEAGLNRLDHATGAWLLGAVVGVEQVRPGRPLPPLGIAATDDSTLVIRLARPDPLLLRKLALPGVAVPWSAKPGPGGWPSGLGAYRVIAASPGRLTLARGDAAAGRSARLSGTADPDTVYVRFVRGAGRVAVLVRAGVPDLVWPVPPGFDLSSLRGDYGVRARPAVPARRLLLIMRPDLPPTTKAPARQALAYGIDRPGVWAKLGRRGLPLDGWLPGAPAFDFPRRDPEQVRAWLDRGRFRRSLHVTLAYSADGAGAEAAPALQAEWARLGLDAERRPLEPSAFAEAARARSGAQLMLVENQPLLDDAAGELVTLVTPPRGPVIGSVRTGWMTREFDPWLRAGASQPLDPRYAQRRLAEDRIALPIANLPWFWIERAASPASFHPWFGPGSR